MSFDPEKVTRIAVWLSEYDDVEVWDDSTHKRGFDTRQEAYQSVGHVKATDYDQLLELYRSATHTATGNSEKVGKVGE